MTATKRRIALDIVATETECGDDCEHLDEVWLWCDEFRTVCEATGIIEIPGTARTIKAGKRFRAVRISESGEYATASIDGEVWAIPALVPARVVEEPKGESDG